MVEKLRSKLKVEGRSFIWFVRKYLPEQMYPAVMSQLNGINSMKPETEKAIEKYLKEGDDGEK